MEIVWVALGLIGICVGWWLTYEWDKSRIEEYLKERGGRVASITWAPFGKGWFGEKNDRIYEVIYYDEEGNQHAATCKTSLLSGVYWSEDRTSHPRPAWWDNIPDQNRAGDPIISHIESPSDGSNTRIALLETENAELRRQLEKAKSTAPQQGV